MTEAALSKPKMATMMVAPLEPVSSPDETYTIEPEAIPMQYPPKMTEAALSKPKMATLMVAPLPPPEETHTEVANSLKKPFEPMPRQNIDQKPAKAFMLPKIIQASEEFTERSKSAEPSPRLRSETPE